jgi:hypothetical protein
MLVADEVMLTAGVTAVFTVMVTAFDVTVVVDAQVALPVISTVITSLLASAAVVKVDKPVPTLLPFFFH